LLDHLEALCGFPKARIVATTTLPEEHYDVLAMSSDAWGDQMKEAVCQLIGATFGLSLSRERRTMDAFLLQVKAGREPTLTRSWGGVYYDDATGLAAPSREILDRAKQGENFFCALCPLSSLADSVSSAAGKPVVGDLGDLPKEHDEVYSLCFPYPKGDVEAFRRGLEENYGFVLVPAQREVEVLVVGPANK
jgi:hypothetical protein